MTKNITPDWYADGHFISAETAEQARAEVKRLYDYDAEEVRPWTRDDSRVAALVEANEAAQEEFNATLTREWI